MLPNLHEGTIWPGSCPGHPGGQGTGRAFKCLARSPGHMQLPWPGPHICPRVDTKQVCAELEFHASVCFFDRNVFTLVFQICQLALPSPRSVRPAGAGGFPPIRGQEPLIVFRRRARRSDVSVCFLHSIGEEQSGQAKELSSRLTSAFPVSSEARKDFFLPRESSFCHIILASQAGREIFLSPDPRTSKCLPPSLPSLSPTCDLNAIYVNVTPICQVAFILNISRNTSHR